MALSVMPRRGPIVAVPDIRPHNHFNNHFNNQQPTPNEPPAGFLYTLPINGWNLCNSLCTRGCSGSPLQGPFHAVLQSSESIPSGRPRPGLRDVYRAALPVAHTRALVDAGSQDSCWTSHSWKAAKSARFRLPRSSAGGKLVRASISQAWFPDARP